MLLLLVLCVFTASTTGDDLSSKMSMLEEKVKRMESYIFQELNALKNSSSFEEINSSRSQHVQMLEDDDVLVDKIKGIIRSEIKEEKIKLEVYVAQEVDKMKSKALADIDGIKTALNIQIGVMQERTVTEMRVLVSKRLEDINLEIRKTSAAATMSVQAAIDKLDEDGKRLAFKLEDDVQNLNLNFSSNIENLLERTDSTLTTITRAFVKQKLMMNTVSADIARKSALLENDVRQAVNEMKEHMENKTLEIEHVQYISTTNLTSFIKNASSLIYQKMDVIDEKEVQLNQSATDAIVALKLSEEANSEFVLYLESKLFENATEMLNQTNQNSNNTLKELITQFKTLSDNLTDRVNVSLLNVGYTLETMNTSVHHKIETKFSTLENSVTATVSRSESILGGRISSNRQYIDSSKNSLQSSISSVQSSISSVQSSITSVRSSVSSAQTSITKLNVKIQLPGLYLNHKYYPYKADVFEHNMRLHEVSTYGAYGVQGRLEVYHYGWGTVCDDGFSGTQGQLNLNVLVKNFNFNYGEYVTNAGMGQGSGKILLDDVKCKSDSTNFLSCPSRNWGDHNCAHSEDLGLKLWR